MSSWLNFPKGVSLRCYAWILHSYFLGFTSWQLHDPDGALSDIDCNLSVHPFSSFHKKNLVFIYIRNASVVSQWHPLCQHILCRGFILWEECEWMLLSFTYYQKCSWYYWWKFLMQAFLCSILMCYVDLGYFAFLCGRPRQAGRAFWWTIDFCERHKWRKMKGYNSNKQREVCFFSLF